MGCHGSLSNARQSNAPQLDPPQLEARATPAAKLPSLRLPPKSFIAPAAPKAVAARVQLAESPSLIPNSATNSAAIATLMDPGINPRLPPKPFMAPPNRQRSSVAEGRSAEMLPAPADLPANAANLNVAVVGLNPTDKPVALPAMPNPADFLRGAETASGGRAIPIGRQRTQRTRPFRTRRARPEARSDCPGVLCPYLVR